MLSGFACLFISSWTLSGLFSWWLCLHVFYNPSKCYMPMHPFWYLCASVTCLIFPALQTEFCSFIDRGNDSVDHSFVESCIFSRKTHVIQGARNCFSFQYYSWGMCNDLNASLDSSIVLRLSDIGNSFAVHLYTEIPKGCLHQSFKSWWDGSHPIHPFLFMWEMGLVDETSRAMH